MYDIWLNIFQIDFYRICRARVETHAFCISRSCEGYSEFPYIYETWGGWIWCSLQGLISPNCFFSSSKIMFAITVISSFTRFKKYKNVDMSPILKYL